MVAEVGYIRLRLGARNAVPAPIVAAPARSGTAGPSLPPPPAAGVRNPPCRVPPPPREVGPARLRHEWWPKSDISDFGSGRGTQCPRQSWPRRRGQGRQAPHSPPPPQPEFGTLLAVCPPPRAKSGLPDFAMNGGRSRIYPASARGGERRARANRGRAGAVRDGRPLTPPPPRSRSSEPSLPCAPPPARSRACPTSP